MCPNQADLWAGSVIISGCLDSPGPFALLLLLLVGVVA